MPVLYWGLVVDSQTHTITFDDKFVAQSDDEAKIKLGIRAGLEDLEDVDVILQRLGPVSKKPKQRRKASQDEDE